MKHNLLLACALLPWALSAQILHFVKVTDANNPAVTFTNNGTPYKGVSWIDLDHDNLTDLFVSPRYLFRNLGNGNFAQLSNLPYTASAELCASAAWGDFDNDGFPDCILSNTHCSLQHNNGDHTFSDQTSNLPLLMADYPAWDCVFADADNNGRLDLLFTHAANFHLAGPYPCKFFLQGTDGVFSILSGFEFTDQLNPYTIGVWSDYDLDGDVDLFIGSGPAGTLGPDFCYQNMLKETGTFYLQRLTAAPFNAWQDGQTYNFPDFDNDGDLDICLTNYGGALCRFWRNNGNGTYTDLSTPFIQQGPHLANCWGDLNNDGYEDVLISKDNATGIDLYKNNGDGTFSAAQVIPVTSGTISVCGIALADYDNDGDLDIYTNGKTTARNLLRNNDSDLLHRHWAEFTLQGVTSNRSALGAIVQLKASLSSGGSPVWQTRQVSGRNSFQSQNDLRQHFGLRESSTIDSVAVRWPSGLKQVFTNLEANKFYKIVEGQDISIITANKEIVSDVELKVGPNPFNDLIQIENPGSGLAIKDINLFNQLGEAQTFSVKKGMENWQVKTAQLPAGAYVLQVTFNNGSMAIRKVIKN